MGCGASAVGKVGETLGFSDSEEGNGDAPTAGAATQQDPSKKNGENTTAGAPTHQVDEFKGEDATSPLPNSVSTTEPATQKPAQKPPPKATQKAEPMKLIIDPSWSDKFKPAKKTQSRSGKSKTREEPNQIELRRLMVTPSHSKAFPGSRAPMWISKCFMGEFGDAFVQDTDLEGGHSEQSIPEFCGVVEQALANYGEALTLLAEEADRAIVQQVLAKLQKAASVAQDLNACRGWTTLAFNRFLEARSEEVRTLAVGDFLLWCGGWMGVNGGHAIMYLVDKTSDSEASFVTINTGQGVGNHPGHPAGYPKDKRFTQMRLNSTVERISNPAWLYFLFKIQADGHKDHTPEILYNVCLPALIGDSLVRACEAQKSIEDPHAVPETLQRSGVCYYRCILSATRYSLRRLGFRQEQVKQLLHVTRRAFVACVAEDLVTLQQIVDGASDGSKDAVQRGLYPSQLQLVRLSSEMLGYSAVKESKAGRLSIASLQKVVSEVENINVLASALPVIGKGEDTNEWMGSQESGEGTAGSGGNFPDAAACSQSLSANLDLLAGSDVDGALPVTVNFCSLPANRADITDFTQLKAVLDNLQALCVAIRQDEDTRLNARLLQILSLIEHSFTVLLPVPVWGDESSLWHAIDQESFSQVRDSLRWLAQEYNAACLSMPVPEAKSVRALTNAAIMIAFFETVRAGPKSGGDSHGDGIIAAMLRESQLGFPTMTRAEEEFVNFTATLVMDTIELVTARSHVCEYLEAMKTSTSDAAFGFAPNSCWELGNESSDVQMTLSIVKRLAADVGGFFENPGEELFKNVKDARQSINQLTDAQQGLAWMLVPYGSSGRHLPGKHSSEVSDWDHFDSWLGLRDMVTLFAFAISAPSKDARAGKVFEHVYGEPVTGVALNGCASLGHSFADTFGFDFGDTPEFDDKFENGEIKRELEGAWNSSNASPSYEPSPADPKMWIEVKPSEGDEDKKMVVTEDDVLHTPNLKDFDGNISQEEAEVLFSYLTAPYLRIPLVIEFFAKDRVGVLFDKRLQELLWHCLFCPGQWGLASVASLSIDTVPCQPEKLSTDRGHFVAELERSPSVFFSALIRLLQDGIRFAVGDFESSFVPVLLYLVRLATRVLAFARSIDPGRASDLASVESFSTQIATWLESATEIIQNWQVQAATGQRKDAECSFQAHIAMLAWTCVVNPSEDKQIDEKMAGRMLGSVAFVNTWNALGDSESAEGTEGGGEGEDEDQEEEDSERKEDSTSAGLFELGVSDQEMFWLVQHKRLLLLSFMKQAESSTLKGVLEMAIRSSTGEADLEWVPSEDGGVKGGAQWVARDDAQDLLGYKDGNSFFFVNVQTCIITYQSSKLKAVPDIIARHPDFYAFFKGAVPHCATLSNLSNRHQVFIPKGQKLISFWQPTDSKLGFPGCPNPPGADGAKQARVIETKHPYHESDQTYVDGSDFGTEQTVDFGEEADVLTVRFDSRSDTEAFYDTLEIIWQDKAGAEQKKRVHSTEFPEELRIDSSKFTYRFIVLGGTDKKWGFRFTVSAAKDISGLPFEFNGICYGGAADREYRYGDASPTDIPWLSAVLDPVLHSVLTEPVKNQPAVLKWKKFETKMEANRLVYLLPSTPNEEATRDTVLLLSISGERDMGKQFWRMLRVSRLMQTVDVFVIDLLGRRAFPRQVYASDSRMSLCSRFPVDPYKKDSMHPARSIVRFAEGTFLGEPIGGNDVLIYDKSNEGKTGVCLFAPPRSLSGTLPGALVEAFDFWENQKSGYLHGNHKHLTRENEHGEKVPFVDPFFNYKLQVRADESSCSSAVVRIDEDPATLVTTARRLVNLRNCTAGSPAAEIVRLLTQIDSLSHVLAWTEPHADADAAFAVAVPDLLPSLVELPRLRVRFKVAVDGGQTTLFVMDRGGSFVLPDQSAVNPELISGSPRCLVLSDFSQALEILVPNYPLTRAKVSCAPFTTWCTPDPNHAPWLSACDSRYYIYVVHPSNAFVKFNSVGSTLYWAFLNFMQRRYEVAFKTIESCTTDMPLSRSEHTMLTMFRRGNDDKHPDAHACRLKLRLSLLHSPIKRWPLVADEGTDPTFAEEYQAYLTKRGHVSMACRLSYLDEVRVIKHMVSQCPDCVDCMVLTRANYLDKRIVGEDRKMLIPHQPCSFECEHPYKENCLVSHSKMFLLPHAPAVCIEFDGRCQSEDYSDILSFGDEDTLWAEISPGDRPARWRKGGFKISGVKSDDWRKSFLIQGCSLCAQFKSDGSGEGLWGYRFTCRPAREEELPLEKDEVPSNTFEAAASPQKDGGAAWNEALGKAIDPFDGAALFENLKTLEPCWFGSVTIDQDLVEPHLEGAEMLAAMDTMWAADFSGSKGGGYPVLMNILSGNSRVSIGGSESSGKLLVEMLVRLGIQLKNEGPEEACQILVASVGLPESVFAGTDGFSSCANYQNEELGEAPVCYLSGGEAELDYADPDVKLHIGTHLRIVGEILCQALSAAEGEESLKRKPGPKQQYSVSLALGDENAERSATVGISNYAQAVFTCTPVDMGPVAFATEELAAFMEKPLSGYINFSDFVSQQDMSREVPSAPPYDLAGHPDAETANAKETMKRLADDCEYYAKKENANKAAVVVGITPELMEGYREAQENAGGPGTIKPSFAETGLEGLSKLKGMLDEGLVADSERLDVATSCVTAAANAITLVEGASEADQRERLEFQLLQSARLQARVTLPYLVAGLVSTKACRDIQSLNSFISNDDVDALLKATAGIVLTANRVSQLRRTIGCVDDTAKAIMHGIDARKMIKEIDSLEGNLLSKRHYVRTATRSHYDPANDEAPQIDPRFLLFEYMTTFILRNPQVYLVQTFMERAVKGGFNAHGKESSSMVHQMIMGAGKTTVIGPLLALMLADGQSLVTQVVPNALLVMSRNVMWAAFCSVITKPVFTLTFDRSWPTRPSVYGTIYEKMVLARQSGGIVITTPSAIKSIVNKYIELLNSVSESPIQRLMEQASRTKSETGKRAAVRLAELQNNSDTGDAIARIMNLWSDREKGVLLLDEVDMLLHPLRSELNFPIGEKFALTPSGMRWDLPIYLLDTVLQAASAAITGSSGSADALVQEMCQTIMKGLRSQRLQRVPHLIILDGSFYQEELRGLLVKRSLSWIKAHHLLDSCQDMDLETGQLEQYINKGNLLEAGLLSAVTALPGNVIQALNFAHDWTCSYAPHILAKVDRVSFGLLQPEDEQMLKGKEQPASRKLLGIPFVGKGVPSAAAEFAQPDVLIGATVLAYRYEGLRLTDLKQAVRLLKEALQLESGPKNARPSYMLFESWVSSACSRQGITSRTVMDLELFQIGDPKQMTALFKLLSMEPEVIHHYLREIVFPRTMQQQHVKISSSGQELGSDILFGRRLGFSGTPSSLLPVELVPCHFEQGSEGKILRMLTDENVTKEASVSRELSEPSAPEWTVQGVLDLVAQSTDPEFRALIDTGALITGYSNEEVARYLVDTGLKHLQGCVFLDPRDEKMIYLRGAARCIPLAECGIGNGERFTFYDQYHTTGMDIKQSLSAAALLTIGKDMTFRDYAQGAFRMRGIGKGQTIHLLIVPEIKKLIAKTLPRLKGHMEDDVAAWLQLNGMMMEKLQFLQLCSQNMQTVWRKVALDMLLASSGVEGVNVVEEIEGARREEFGDKMGTGMMRFCSDGKLCTCISALRDVVDFEVPQCVPNSEPYSETLQKMVDARNGLVKTPAQAEVISIVMQQVDDALKSNATKESASAKKGLNSEMTREKEREQEQQKQKQQQQQQESMFERDTSNPISWAVSALSSQPQASMEEGILPFYRLSQFSPRPFEFSFTVDGREPTLFPAVDPMSFPQTVLQSMNFAPLERADACKPLRLKNVCMLLDWYPDSAASEHLTVVLTLGEAETLRKLIQDKRMGSEAPPDQVAVAIVHSPSDTVVDATKNYPGFNAAGATKLSKDQLCVKFWNSDMYYKQDDLATLLEAVESNSVDARRTFFEAAIVARRRSRKSWAGTPLRSVFSFESDEEYMDTIGLLQQIQSKMREDKVDVVQACDRADLDGNGFLSQQELMSVFDAFGLPAVTSARLQKLMELMDVEGDNAIDYSEFSALLGADATIVSQMKAISKQGGGSSDDKAGRKEQARLAHESRLEAEGMRDEEWDAQFLERRESERKLREERKSDEVRSRSEDALRIAEESRREWSASCQNGALAKLQEEQKRLAAAERGADFGLASGAQTSESKHPFEEGDYQEGTVTFPSHVKNIQISFDEKSQPDEWAIHCLEFTWDRGSKEFRGADAFCKFTIRSNQFQFSWRVSDPNESEAWGWKFTATPK